MEINIYLKTFLILAATYVCGVAVSYIWKMYKNRWTLMQMFPCLENNHWLFGHLFTFPGLNDSGLLLSIKNTAKYPRYYLFCLGPFRTVLVLNHPQTIKQLTKTSEPKQLSGGGGYGVLTPWIGDGLLLSSGKKWARNRRLITPGFHFDVLKAYVDVFNDCLDTLIDRFIEESYLIGVPVDITKPVGLCTLDIILRCAFSTNKDIQGKGSNSYVNNVNELSEGAVKRVLNPPLFPGIVYFLTPGGRQYLKNCVFSHKVATEIIEKRIKEIRKKGNMQDTQHNGRYVDFLDILLLAKDEDGNGLSSQEILDEVETFMFGGHDTTASAISWLLYNLARHPNIQAKAVEEVDSLLDERDNDRLLWEDLAKLPYLSRCIKESLRLHSTVPFIGRELKNSLQMDDKIIPAGTNVNVNIWNLHHNPEVWPDPMKYDPDRFLPEKVAEMDSHAFMPFSAGPRNCIGQNFAMNAIKTAAARILHRFQLTISTAKPAKMKPDLVLRAENGIHLYFT